VPVGVLGLLLVAGCSSQERVDVEGFAPGPCADAADTLVRLDETLIETADEEISPAEADMRLEIFQDELLMVRDSAQPPLTQTFTDLVTALGFFRISVDSNNYDGSQVGDARIPFDALVRACTPDPPG
jgi:hypothetical protein